jgi:hypothetical protein
MQEEPLKSLELKVSYKDFVTGPTKLQILGH